ncbi:MAG: tRNA (cytidine(34)-2'-O)-methyltransferase [Tissierellia bacterium]|nr:tRNA (cytidine(34)-2'-O)-methyltransferase [Tissierellia bacterium]
MALNICLVQPEIPHNTGAIARTCGLTQTRLHLVRPLGFSTEDKYLKRAGLDYWHLVDISYYDDFSQVEERFKDSHIYLATTHGAKNYTTVQYEDEDVLVFGRETSGLSEEIHSRHPKNRIRIPMLKDYGRSLNLANSANIILYEALRQLNFPGLE